MIRTVLLALLLTFASGCGAVAVHDSSIEATAAAEAMIASHEAERKRERLALARAMAELAAIYREVEELDELLAELERELQEGN